MARGPQPNSILGIARNVWYFGEHVTEYKNGEVTGHEGSWESGVEGAEPGIVMPAKPKFGDTYRQEYSKGVSEDRARVVRLDGSATVCPTVPTTTCS
jgi:hypothetical protein